MSDLPFTCPYCETEIQLPEDVWYFSCPQCRRNLDLKSQFAFQRGLEAFSEGQDIIVTVSPRGRRTAFNPKIDASIRLFLEAYSSLQVAFQADLAEAQRSLAVEMMASMAQEFIRRNMISALELSYWTTLMVEYTAQKEYGELAEKINSSTGPAGAILRLRWRARQKQLLAALEDVDRKIRALERQIEFIEVPHARNKMWKP